MLNELAIDQTRIDAFCQRWGVLELALFGSVLRADFGPDSDVDVLVTLAPSTEIDLFDWMTMEEELSSILGRPVDLVEKSTIQNPYRRERILSTCKRLYGA